MDAIKTTNSSDDITRAELLQLLEINKAMSQARTCAELLDAIRGTVRQLIPFDDIGILIVENDGLHHYEMALNTQCRDESEVDKHLHERGILRTPHPGSYMEYVMKLIEESNSPIIEDYQKRFNEFIYPSFPSLAELGYKEGLVTSLTTGGKAFGTFCLNSRQESHFEKNHFRLFEAIAEQVSIAISTILYRQEMLAREHEKTELLEITELIAQVKDNHELLKLIMDKVKPMFRFHDCGLFILSSDGSTHSDWCALPGVNPSEGNQIIAPVAFGVQHKDSVIEWVMGEIEKTGGPVLFDFKYLFERFPDYPLFVAVSSMTNVSAYRDGLATNLLVRGKTIGMFCINALEKDFFQPSVFPLFKSVAHTISIAVANILANEEILQSEREKSELLSIAQALATVQDRAQLLKVIYNQIHCVFPFADAGLFVVDAQGQHRDLLVDEQILDKPATQQLAKEQLSGPLPPHPVITYFLRHGPVVEPLEKLYVQFPDHPHYPAIQAAGYTEMLGGPLRNGGELIGVLCFFPQPGKSFSSLDFPVFQGISDQLSVAVANILAKEGLRKSANEKTLLLRLSTELSLKKNIQEVTALIFERIKILVNAEAIVLMLLSEDNKCIRAVHHETHTAVLKFYQSNEKYRKLFDADVPVALDPFISSDNVLEKQEPYYVNVSDILERYPTYGWASLMREAGAKSMTTYVLRLNGQSLGVMFWHWPTELSDTKALFPIIQGIGDLTAITISNLLSVARLQERAWQIEVLNDKLEEQNAYLEEEILDKYNFTEIIGESPALQNVYHNINLVSKSDTTVLITGESGTGKELVARAIHEASDRRGKTLIKLNCAALPPQLIESELFGHEKGAFTGALERRIGKFELAHDSTIFLDEVGELPLDLQTKLLRVLQERELERLGGNKVIKVNVRVLSATNRNLQKEVQAGRFRSDLYYRLNVFPIHLPPLRERPEDIPPLVQHFLKKFQKKLGKQITTVSKKVMNELASYSWPGNIRELEHVLERSCILCSDKVMKQIFLPKINSDVEQKQNSLVLETLAENERNYIVRALKQCNGKVSGPGGAAELLNIKPSTLDFRIKKLGIKRDFI